MADDGRSRTLLWVVIGGGAFFLFLAAVFTLVYVAMKSDRQADGFARFGEKIAVVDIEGVLIEPQQVVKHLKQYGDDDSIKAIILHMNTPGGGVAASEEIYEAVKRIREKKKKRIVTSIETVGASGGYYIATASDKIYANHGSIVGSIGVIANWVNYSDLLRWAKLKDVTFKAGAFKDTGNPAREMTEAERAYLQSIIDDLHTQFINAVAAGRKMKPEEIRGIADGKVWTGEQALNMKLVDQLGDFQTAVEQTAKEVGIKGEPTLVRPYKDRRTVLDLLFGDVSKIIPDRTMLLQEHPGFFYLWK